MSITGDSRCEIFSLNSYFVNQYEVYSKLKKNTNPVVKNEHLHK